ncbi:hypothetical protein [Shewanella gaetbuli]
MTVTFIQSFFAKTCFMACALVVASLCLSGQAVGASDKPWDYDNNIYSEPLDESIENGGGNQELLNKYTQWDVCSRMAPSTDRMAFTVKVVKESQSSLDELRELFEDEWPINEGYFRDVINKKKIELAFEMAELTNDEETSDESVVTQAAWDWCIAQDPENFEELS